MATYHVETEGGHVYQVETDDTPQSSALEAAARGAGNNFPLLPQAIAGLSSGNYSQNLADWKAKAAAAKSEHPIAYGAGAVAGATAPLLIPGVGEALEAAPVLGNVAYGAASAISDDDLSQDPTGALKDAAIGGITGGTVGGVSKVISGAADTVGQYAGRFGDDQAIKAIGKLPPGMKVDEAREVARRATENYGLLDADMGPIGRKATVQAMGEQSGYDLGALREAAGADGPLMTQEQMADAIRERLKGAYSRGGENYDQINALEQQLQNIKSMPSSSPADFAGRATAINNKAAGNRAILPTNVDTDVANSLSHINDEAIAAKLPDQADQYSQLRQTFGDTKTLQNMIERGERRSAMSRGSNTFYEAGSKFVDELGAHKAGARLGIGADNLLHSKGLQTGLSAGALNTTAVITSTILQALQSNPQSLGKYAKPLAQAAQGGPQGIAATHYVLSTTDPAYNDMWQKHAGGQ